MNRVGNLYDRIVDINNLLLAEKKARKGKTKQHGVILFDRHPQDNIINLHHVLNNKEYITSEYTIFTIKDPKEREIFRLPYYPDRIVHHAVMNILEPIFVSTFTSNTYSCIKGRGIHKCLRDVKSALKDEENTRYCLKLDIKKFYPSINHDILKQLLRRKFKDNSLLELLDEIIDSANGVPIGNYLSQYLANFYLTYFDHWLKENKRVKYYFRYCDDLVIFGSNKEELHNLLKDIVVYLHENLKLQVKGNYQVFPVDSRGVDFVGYKCYHTHIVLRKSIKKRFIRMIKHNDNIKSRASYNGWLVHCDSINLQKKYLTNEWKQSLLLNMLTVEQKKDYH